MLHQNTSPILPTPGHNFQSKCSFSQPDGWRRDGFVFLKRSWFFVFLICFLKKVLFFVFQITCFLMRVFEFMRLCNNNRESWYHCIRREMIREVPPLTTLILKEISKKPGVHITPQAIARARTIRGNWSSLTQTIVNYVTEAGRFTDDVIPVSMWEEDIEEISLKNSKVSGRYILHTIDRCKSLVKVDISGCFLVDDASVLYILQKLKNLVELNIRNCRKITDTSLHHIRTHGTKLEVLYIGGNFNVTDKGVMQLLRHHPNISSFRELNLSGLPLSPDSLKLLTSYCTSLTGLSVAYCDISPQNLLFVVEAMASRLQRLCIGWIPYYSTSDATCVELLEVLSKQCPALTELDISGLRSINAGSLQQFLDNRTYQVNLFPTDFAPMTHIRAKYIGSEKGKLDIIANVYSFISFEI